MPICEGCLVLYDLGPEDDHEGLCGECLANVDEDDEEEEL